MIVESLPNKKQQEAQLTSPESDTNDTTALEELPPSFEQTTEDRLLPDPPQQDPPPAFSPYTASFYTAGNGAIVSHDPHLNEDGVYSVRVLRIYRSNSNAMHLGEALYRFLLAHSSTPPTFHLHIKGTHKETRTRIVDSHHHGGNGHRHLDGRTRLETYTEVVVDFDFQVDLTQNIITDPAHAPVQWSIPDDEPAHRGKVYQQVEVSCTPIGETQMRKPNGKERKEYKLWCKERIRKGLPPWIGSYSRSPSASWNALSEGEIQLKSSRTVRQWCDDYCASNKILKEFVYTKVCFGEMIIPLLSHLHSTVRVRLGFWRPRTSYRILDCQTDILWRETQD